MKKIGLLSFTNLFLKCREDLLTPLRLEVVWVGQILHSVAEKCSAINPDKTRIQIQGKQRFKNAAYALTVSIRDTKMPVFKFYPKFNDFNLWQNFLLLELGGFCVSGVFFPLKQSLKVGHMFITL